MKLYQYLREYIKRRKSSAAVLSFIIGYKRHSTASGAYVPPCTQTNFGDQMPFLQKYTINPNTLTLTKVFGLCLMSSPCWTRIVILVSDKHQQPSQKHDIPRLYSNLEQSFLTNFMWVLKTDKDQLSTKIMACSVNPFYDWSKLFYSLTEIK